MTSFDSFLHPERKPNLCFKLGSFSEEFEMRQLSASEDMELIRSLEGDNNATTLIHYAAEALVVPDLHNKALLDALSERERKPIMNAADALVAMTSSSELAAILQTYTDFSRVSVSFKDGVEAIKNG